VPGKYPWSRWRAKKSVQNQPLDTEFATEALEELKVIYLI
jgi:hypothetical protein